MQLAPPQLTAVPCSNVVSKLSAAFNAGELADVSAVRRKRDALASELEKELMAGLQSLAEQVQTQKEKVGASVRQERHRYNLAMDQQVKNQELVLSQQYNEQLMRLQQAAQAQRAELEKQACGLTLEYQQRKVQEEFMAQQAGIQKQHEDAQMKLAAEMEKLGLPQTQLFMRPGSTAPASMPLLSELAGARPAGCGVRPQPPMPRTAAGAPLVMQPAMQPGMPPAMLPGMSAAMQPVTAPGSRGNSVGPVRPNGRDPRLVGL